MIGFFFLILGLAATCTGEVWAGFGAVIHRIEGPRPSSGRESA